jgi:hypothetical protein
MSILLHDVWNLLTRVKEEGLNDLFRVDNKQT